MALAKIKNKKSKNKKETFQEEKTLDIKEKIKNPRVLIPLLVIATAGLLFYFKGLFVAALVNGQPILRLTIIKELEKQGGKQTLSSLVNQTLILQEAKKKNIEVNRKEIDEEAKQIEESLKQQGQDLNIALAMQGLTRQDFLMQLRLKSLVEKLLADQTKVTDKEVSEYIEKNKETLPTNLKDDEIKKGVREQLKQQKIASASQAWLADLTKNAKINYFVNY